MKFHDLIVSKVDLSIAHIDTIMMALEDAQQALRNTKRLMINTHTIAMKENTEQRTDTGEFGFLAAETQLKNIMEQIAEIYADYDEVKALAVIKNTMSGYDAKHQIQQQIEKEKDND